MMPKETEIFLFLLSAEWNVNEMAGTPTAILDHREIFEKYRTNAQ